MNTLAVPGADAIARGREHAMLRFATGVTAAFLMGEIAGWIPSFLGALLAGTLLANLPSRPPFKVGAALVAVTSAAALFAFVLASLLHLRPSVLFGLVALGMFLCFYVMHTGKGFLPMLLTLVCLATIPVIVLTAPAYAKLLPIELIRGVTIAILTVWAMFAVWPQALPAPEKPAAVPASAPALATALLSTAVVLPVLLAFLLFGVTDAFPVITTTVILVANFDIRKSGMQAGAMVLGNFIGGAMALGLHLLLLTTPNLVFLGLSLFLANLWFGNRIAAGGPAAGVAGIACNAMLIILGTAIATGPGSFSIWATRLSQFVVAGAFAIGMMIVVWHASGHAHKALASRNDG